VGWLRLWRRVDFPQRLKPRLFEIFMDGLKAVPFRDCDWDRGLRCGSA
jgi:hypothetical protein